MQMTISRNSNEIKELLRPHVAISNTLIIEKIEKIFLSLYSHSIMKIAAIINTPLLKVLYRSLLPTLITKKAIIWSANERTAFFLQISHKKLYSLHNLTEKYMGIAPRKVSSKRF